MKADPEDSHKPYLPLWPVSDRANSGRAHSSLALERLLAELVDLRLMLRDDGHYLSLAICAERNAHGECSAFGAPLL